MKKLDQIVDLLLVLILLFNFIGLNIKKLQQEIRVSKKTESLTKEKLAQTKKAYERLEKEYAKYKEDAESRIENYKNDIQILKNIMSNFKPASMKARSEVKATRTQI